MGGIQAAKLQAEETYNNNFGNIYRNFAAYPLCTHFTPSRPYNFQSATEVLPLVPEPKMIKTKNKGEKKVGEMATSTVGIEPREAYILLPFLFSFSKFSFPLKFEALAQVIEKI